MEWLIWAVIGFAPAIALAGLAWRAFKSDSADAWADHGYLGRLVGWISSGIAVIAAQPLLSVGIADRWTLAGLCIAPLIAVDIVEFTVSVRYWGLRRGIWTRCSAVLRRLMPALSVGVLFVVLFGPNQGNFKLDIGLRLFICVKLTESAARALFIGSRTAGYYYSGKWLALDPCELYTKALEIAERLGVRLRQFSIVTNMDRTWAGGLAYGAHSIALTEDLVKNLSKPEVDSVVNHELGHLTKKNYWWLYKPAEMAVLLLWLSIAAVIERGLHAIPIAAGLLSYPFWISLFLIPGLAHTFYSRRMERMAVAIAAEDNPRATILGQWKLIILDKLPASRPWWSMVMSTHPTTEEIETKIAERYGLSHEEIEALHREAEDDLREPVSDRYEPVYPKPSAGEVLKRPSSGLLRFAQMVLAGAAVPVLILSFLLEDRFAEYTGTVSAVFICLGMTSVVIGVLATVLDRWRSVVAGRFAARLRAVLGEKYPGKIDDHTLVADTIFGWDWDAQTWQGAALVIDDGRLRIYGECQENEIEGVGVTRIAVWETKGITGCGPGAVLWYEREGTHQWMAFRFPNFGGVRPPRRQRMLRDYLRAHLLSPGGERKATPARVGLEMARRASIALGLLATVGGLTWMLCGLLAFRGIYWAVGFAMVTILPPLWSWIANARSEESR